jgi:hypothetical protein
VNNFYMIGKAGAPSFKTHETFHVTFTPSGNLTASHDSLRITCGLEQRGGPRHWERGTGRGPRLAACRATGPRGRHRRDGQPFRWRLRSPLPCQERVNGPAIAGVPVGVVPAPV